MKLTSLTEIGKKNLIFTTIVRYGPVLEPIHGLIGDMDYLR